MTRFHRMTLVLALASIGCGPGDGAMDAPDPGTDDGGGDDDGGTGMAPHRDAWRIVHHGPFEALDDDGTPTITALTIGRALGYADNFANRGDVIVTFDGEPGTITIEMRRFTFAPSPEQADASYAKLWLWAYAAATDAPKRPALMDDADRCGGVDPQGVPYPWRDGCAIYVYYDGQSQPARTGADLRVTLPPEYHGRVSVSTADNVVEDTYPNRGNVCVDGLAGQLDVELQSGVAFVSVAAAHAYPSCPAELVADCEAFDEPGTDGPDAWAAGCGCIAQGYEPGAVAIASLAPAPADLTVDVPAGLWTSFRAENAGDNALDGEHCLATIGALGPTEYASGMNDPNKPWLRGGIANRPDAAPAGGFRVELTSHGCGPVAAVESPEAWDGDVVDPPPLHRGELELCSGCLIGSGCDALLPD